MIEFYEQLVKKKSIINSNFKIGLMVFVGALFLFLSFRQQLFYIAFILYIIAAYFYIWPMINIEYEYEFLQEEISFDIIYNQVKRKRLKTISIKNIQYMSKLSNNESKRYNNSKGKNFSNGKKDETYIIVLNSGDKILFSPDETALKYIKSYTINIIK